MFIEKIRDYLFIQEQKEILKQQKINLLSEKFAVKKIIETKDFKFYKVVKELYDGKEFHCKDFEMESAYSLPEGHYIGDSKTANRLVNQYGIEKFEKAKPHHNVCSIGFSPKEGKWFGFSHRAIYGFKEGSKVKKGDCGYKSSNKKEFLEDLEYWYHNIMEYDDLKLTPKKEGVHVKGFSTKIKNSLGVDKIEKYPKNWGRGEWTAKTLEDAKQMAIDFAEGVS